MGEIGSDTAVHVVRGAPWKDAIIALLEPKSPYRPWRAGPDVTAGNAVVAVLDTDPASIIAEVRIVGADGRPDLALAGCVHREQERESRPSLLELATLTALMHFGFRCAGTSVIIEDAEGLIETMGAPLIADNDALYLNGHTTLAAARILLRSGGRCTGCDHKLDLADVNARYHVHIHTVDLDPTAPPIPVALEVPPPEDAGKGRDGYGPESIRLASDYWRPIRPPLDWPAVLCDSCHDRMRSGGFTSFVDYRFSLHPSCPSCFARWTMRTTAGFLAESIKEPWIRHTGCCPDQRWLCGACGHGWGGRYEPGS